MLDRAASYVWQASRWSPIQTIFARIETMDGLSSLFGSWTIPWTIQHSKTGKRLENGSRKGLERLSNGELNRGSFGFQPKGLPRRSFGRFRDKWIAGSRGVDVPEQSVE
jgi:hypothetical protein